MDGGERSHSEKLELKAKARDREDFVAAMNDIPNGRPKRFGAEQERIQAAEDLRIKKQNEAELVRQSAAYQALFQQTMQDLHDTRDLVYAARVQSGMELEQAEKRLKETLAQASTTADGEAVFLSVDGIVYQKDGYIVDGLLLDDVDWREDAPSWEEYQARKADVQAKQARFNQMNAHEMRLAEIEEHMTVEDHPPTMEEMEAYKDEINAIKKDAMNSNPKPLEAQIAPVAAEKLPDLPVIKPMA